MDLQLYMVLMGCTPKGRRTEQHDIFFGIGTGLKDLLPDMLLSWPEAKGKLHIDAWRLVTHVNGYSVTVVERDENIILPSAERSLLFFLNLGGYKEKEFEEFHYKMLVVGQNVDNAKATAKEALFYKHTTLDQSPHHRNATSHIDNKYGLDVDDVHNIEDILPRHLKKKYRLAISKEHGEDDPYHLGYTRLDEL